MGMTSSSLETLEVLVVSVCIEHQPSWVENRAPHSYSKLCRKYEYANGIVPSAIGHRCVHLFLSVLKRPGRPCLNSMYVCIETSCLQ